MLEEEEQEEKREKDHSSVSQPLACDPINDSLVAASADLSVSLSHSLPSHSIRIRSDDERFHRLLFYYLDLERQLTPC